jgi:hypothetical protein
MAKKQESPQQQPPKMSRFDAAALVVRQLTEPVTLTRLNEIAYECFVEAGGKTTLKTMLWDTKQAIKAATVFGIVTVDREVTVRPVNKP